MPASNNSIFDIISPELNFYDDIEAHVTTSNVEYLDAILTWATKRNVELDQLVPLIKGNPNLCLRLTIEAEKLHLIEKTTRLPLA